MARIALFSLETIMSLPRLYANAIQRALPNLERECILEALAGGVDNAILNLCALGSQPATGLDRVTISYLLDHPDFVEKLRSITDSIKRYLPEGAYKNVKANAYTMVRELLGNEVRVGIIHPMEIELLKRILENSKLRAEPIGYETRYDSTGLKHAISVAKRGTDAWLFARNGNYAGTASELGIQYVDCLESIEAPLALARSAFNL